MRHAYVTASLVRHARSAADAEAAARRPAEAAAEAAEAPAAHQPRPRRLATLFRRARALGENQVVRPT